MPPPPPRKYVPQICQMLASWASQLWSSGVSLKRSCKMQIRRADLASIGPPSQKLWPNVIFAWFPQCNYNTNYPRCGVTGWTCFVSIFLFSLSFLYNLATIGTVPGDSDNFWIFLTALLVEYYLSKLSSNSSINNMFQVVVTGVYCPLVATTLSISCSKWWN